MTLQKTPIYAAILVSILMAGTSVVCTSAIAADPPAAQAKAGWYGQLVNVDGGFSGW